MSRPVRKLQRGAHEGYQLCLLTAFRNRQSRPRIIPQGYFGSFTHKDRIALDFAMKRGTAVRARAAE